MAVRVTSASVELFDLMVDVFVPAIAASHMTSSKACTASTALYDENSFLYGCAMIISMITTVIALMAIENHVWLRVRAYAVNRTIRSARYIAGKYLQS